MKEYKGYGGGKVIIDGDDLHIKQAFIKEDCTFADIISINWTEPIALTNGKLEIYTNRQAKPPHTIFFLKKDKEDFIELHDLIAERIGEKDLSGQKAENIQIQKENALAKKDRVAQMDQEGIAYCPKCKSTSLSANKKGFGIGKAVVGAALTGGIGLVAGNIGAKKVRVTCLKCGHQFWAGKQ